MQAGVRVSWSLGEWFKTWVEQNGDGSDYNDGVEGWLGVTRKADILTVTYETEPGPDHRKEVEYYRVARIAEPPTSIPLT